MRFKRSRDQSQHLLCFHKFVQGYCSSSSCSKSHYAPYRLRMLGYVQDANKKLGLELTQLKLDLIDDNTDPKLVDKIYSSGEILLRDLRRLCSEMDRYLHTSRRYSNSISRSYSSDRPVKRRKSQQSPGSSVYLPSEGEITENDLQTQNHRDSREEYPDLALGGNVDWYHVEKWYVIDEPDTLTSEKVNTNSHPSTPLETTESPDAYQPQIEIPYNDIEDPPIISLDLPLPKLEVILDLDSTLLEAIQEEQLKVPAPAQAEKIHFEIDHRNYTYHIFLRPGIIEFLTNLTQFCRAWIYTSGARQYTLEAMKVLDPKGAFFSDRILAAESCSTESRKKSTAMIKNLFPDFNPLLAMIIDDNVNVWEKEDWDKLIPTMAFSPFKKVRHYLYNPRVSNHLFEDTKQRFLEKHDEFGYQLPSLENILKRIHSEIGKSNDLAAEEVFGRIRKETMEGAKLSFRMYLERLDNKIYTSNKYQTYKFIAEQMGARVEEAEDAIQVLENVKDKRNEKVMDSSEILRCYFHMKRL
jgi:hypothetical protein